MLRIWRDDYLTKEEIRKAFLEVRTAFPFPGYMDDKLNKYVLIISEIARVPKGSEILSIGCGPCDLEAILSKLGYNVTGVDDLSDHWHLIGKNRERIIEFCKKMGVKLIVQPFETVQLNENYFDAVLLIDVLEHLHRSPRELLNKSISSLKVGGLLLIETPNAAALAKRLKALFGKSSHVDVDFFYWNIGEYRSHIREYTRPELKQIISYHKLASSHFKMTNIGIENIETHGFLSRLTVNAYKLISGLYPNFRATILVSARKPEEWKPTDASIEDFKMVYPHLTKYNIDNERDNVLINKIQKPTSRYKRVNKIE